MLDSEPLASYQRATITLSILLLLLFSGSSSMLLVVLGEQTKPNVSIKVSTSIIQHSLQANRHQRSPVAIVQADKFRNEDAIVATQTQNQKHNQDQLHPAGKIRWPQESSGYSRSTSSSLNFMPTLYYNEPSQLDTSAAATNEANNKITARSYDEQANGIQAKQKPLKCPSRSLGNILKSAKNLLTDGFATIEQRATTGNILFGSAGLIAAAIPLAALLMPDNANNHNSNKRNGGLKLGVGGIESVMGWVERSIEHLPNFPRLHPQECVKRSICEAHNKPEKYGAIGFTLRLLFPANNLSSTDRMDNMEYKVINKYRHAAGYGLNKRLDSNGTSSNSVCREKYEDCLISLLEVAKNLVDIFLT